jgi:hypothetical protein
MVGFPVQTTSEFHPPSHSIGTWDACPPGIKWLMYRADHTHIHLLTRLRMYEATSSFHYMPSLYSGNPSTMLEFIFKTMLISFN